MRFLVTASEQGPGWDPSRSMRKQSQWPEHATLINSLAVAGVVVLGGSRGEGPRHRALRMIHWAAPSEIHTCSAEDPWVRPGILRTVPIGRWTVLAGDGRLGPALAEIARAGS